MYGTPFKCLLSEVLSSTSRNIHVIFFIDVIIQYLLHSHLPMADPHLNKCKKNNILREVALCNKIKIAF